MTSSAFPTVLAAMTAAHHVGDYLLQNHYQAQHKPESWAANQAHVAGYHLAQLAAVGLASHVLVCGCPPSAWPLGRLCPG